MSSNVKFDQILKQIDILINKVDVLTEKMNEFEEDQITFQDNIKEIVILKNSIIEESLSIQGAKLDLFANKDIIELAPKSVKKTTTTQSPLMFIKSQMKHDINKYLNDLYTNEDLEDVEENDKVKSKKAGISKNEAIASAIFTTVIKPNSTKLEQLKKIQREFNGEEETKEE